MFARLFGLKTISPEHLLETLNDGQTTVVDVNAPLSFSTHHVPRAINLDPLGYAESDLPANKDSRIVFYCSNFLCRKAPNAARRAETMGYRNVHVMSAGIAGWLKANLPTENKS
ncbi:MAG TPA: rhodanese-like domain-containing protein [Thermoanaerobaculia bacterium]